MELYIAETIVVMLFHFGVITANLEPVRFDKSNQGVTNMTVHPIPINTEQVMFYDNAITCVPAGYFVNLSALDKVWLYGNQISSIDDYAFINIPTLTYMDFEDNNLEVIGRNMFAGLVNLRKLFLPHNKIHTIEAQSLKNCRALEWLAISNNLLQSIPQAMFDLLNHPCNLGRFWMENNPLSCNQSLCWLKRADWSWITVNYAHGTLCAGPDHLSGQRWDLLNIQDLQCDAPTVPGQLQEMFASAKPFHPG